MAPRQNQPSKAPRGRLAGSMRSSDAPEPQKSPQKTKASVSISGMFKKKRPHRLATPTNGATKATKSSLNGRETRATKPVGRPHAPSILKKQGRTPRKPSDHPLSIAFKETTTTYRTTLLTSAQTALHETHNALLARLNAPSSDPTHPLHPASSDQPKPTTPPLRDEQLAITTTSPASGSAPVRTQTTLGAQADAFRATVAREERRLARLRKEWLSLRSQIAAFAVAVLGPVEGGALCRGAGVVVKEGDIAAVRAASGGGGGGANGAGAGDAWIGVRDAEAALETKQEELKREIEGLSEEAVKAMEREVREEEKRGKEMRRSIVALVRDQLGVVDAESME